MHKKLTIETVQHVLHNGADTTILYDPPAQPPVPGEYRAITDLTLHTSMRAFCEQEYPRGLFRHQHEALGRVLAGHNTVVTTRTSSGKSLIYSLPAFDAICRDPQSTALFLYPQKALANDQMLKLQHMAHRIDEVAGLLEQNPLLISRYDGSTPKDERSEIRQGVQLLLTNPDMLHIGILQNHARHWSQFFGHLKLVAVDECHEYRGVFGTNVAYILRRLRQICRLYGSEPQFVATSATVSDPQKHLENLTGLPFTCITPEQDGSIQGRRKFWMVGSDEHYYNTGRNVALALAEAGLSVLAFCPSRLSAERIVSQFMKSKDDYPYVRVYRSGLSADQREGIEQGLREGNVRLVFSTSALELGIDIGQLDAIVCIGLPTSMMSLWQRAGRAARGGREGAIVLVPADTPIDTHYATNPEELFGRGHEPLALNLSNERLACQHYACAIQEVGGDDETLDLEVMGPDVSRIQVLRSTGELNRDEFYRTEPHREVNIRSIGEGVYDLEVGDHTIGTIDSVHLLREAYRNAIYRHCGKAYRVKDVIRGRRAVRLQPEYSGNDTTPFLKKKIRLKRQHSVKEYSGIKVATASLDVTEFLINVTEKDRSGKVVRQWPGASGMPAHQLPTEGVMLAIKQELWNEFAETLGESLTVGFRSCERLFCGLFPTIGSQCDLQDFSSGVDSLLSGEQAFFLYDQVYDGIGLTSDAFDHVHALVSNALERVRSCECNTDQGCIRCIVDPLLDAPASKMATQSILVALRDMLAQETPKLCIGTDDGVAGLQPDHRQCLQCEFRMSFRMVRVFVRTVAIRLKGNNHATRPITNSE